MAKNNFKDVGFKNIFKNAFKAMTWVIKLATHLGTLKKKRFDNVVFSDHNKLVGVRNPDGKLLWIPVEYLEQFANCPDSFFNNLAKVIDNERVLVVGYAENNTDNKKVEARVNLKNKLIFLQEENSEEDLFPELKHNDFVELYGYITRGNEKANNLGFLYNGHIITCYPNEGYIKNYRQALFNNCLIRGFVERIDINGHAQKRPSIKFSNISINDPGGNQLRLF
ncbi:hypothetical protein K3G39_13490 [Pontibacter sp. HSC-14F20]|uniref:hypothetical protein n=1 Tax=Pontibacter sp. HSC-14F20 TaxID=2864136 RepID=UPI001C737397|nr:hypothetical protein [Pontibacter sp. HSC-14F20]MBX0334251.1 hypothetical protein [Pontibacter sp. HSC-14F20]